MSFQKVMSSHLPVFYLCSTKNKDIALKFCIHNVCMYRDKLYSVFLFIENFGLNSQLFSENINFDFLGQHRKISKPDIAIL